MLTTLRERLWVYEFLAASSAAMVMLTMIRLMLTRLAKPKQKKRTRMMKTKVA